MFEAELGQQESAGSPEYEFTEREGIGEVLLRSRACRKRR